MIGPKSNVKRDTIKVIVYISRDADFNPI